ncbi:hypothetical protein DUI87_28320 [Hirundo rustica rustica]|uniref:EF-hand domain-containing protein n=1 Tax=Hirundo rustica rustica TaxID=333673 RepID=A0A3M0J8Y0_HIRRU|nr:hypothetical protein DUI87_28320 [Hirundo rustica rustica]
MEPASLLRFLRKLKEVFDVCDEDADGFIRVEHFVALGLQFGQGDESRCVSGTGVNRDISVDGSGIGARGNEDNAVRWLETVPFSDSIEGSSEMNQQETLS